MTVTIFIMAIVVWLWFTGIFINFLQDKAGSFGFPLFIGWTLSCAAVALKIMGIDLP